MSNCSSLSRENSYGDENLRNEAKIWRVAPGTIWLAVIMSWDYNSIIKSSKKYVKITEKNSGKRRARLDIEASDPTIKIADVKK
jgi:hypothetical protein